MMADLFELLSGAMGGAAGIALVVAFAWGVLSMVLSPCHLASIPLIVGLVHGQGPTSAARAVGLSSLFALGILVTIALLGVVTALLGRVVGDVGEWAWYAVAVVFFAVGLHLLDVLPAPWAGPSGIGLRRKGMLAALVLGLVFGIALGPCTFAFMAPVLGITFGVAGTRPGYAASLLLLYGLGHCSIIVAAGSATQAVQRYLDWSQRLGATQWIRRACGILVIGGGLYLLHAAP